MTTELLLVATLACVLLCNPAGECIKIQTLSSINFAYREAESSMFMHIVHERFNNRGGHFAKNNANFFFLIGKFAKILVALCHRKA